MALSDARKRANEKYNAKAYEQIQLRIKKGQKKVIQDHAVSMGESVNGFILRAIKNQMEIDKHEQGK